MYFTTEPPPKPGLPLFTTVVCLVCVLILVINGWSLFHNLSSLKGANATQSQTARVSDKMQYLNVLVMDAESSLRGYFLSGSDVYLRPLNTATREIDDQFRQLDALLADSPSQRRNLAQLRTLVQRKLDTMEQILEVYRKGGLEDVVKIAAYSDDKSMLDEIRLQVVIMVKEQNELLAARSAAFYREYQNAVLLGIGINVAAIVVLALFYRLIRRGYYARQAAQRALEHANENLESMVTVRTEQLSVLSRHLISVSEEEKARLARELHDELGANLTAIGIDINAVADHVRPQQPALAGMLERARATLVDTVELKRRIVEDLRPSLLDNLGLATALEHYGKEFATVTGLECEVLIEGDVNAAGPMQSIAVFRIVQESLNNIAKYAKARTVIVHLAREGEGMALEVSDDGIGIAIDAVSKPKSHGLLGMRERALLLGGTLRIRRGVNDVGTCIEAYIPIAGQDAGGAPDDQPAQASTAMRPAVGETSFANLSSGSNSVAGSNGVARSPGFRIPGAKPGMTGAMPAAVPEVAALFSVPHPSAGDRTPSSQPYSIRRHIPRGPGGRAR